MTCVQPWLLHVSKLPLMITHNQANNSSNNWNDELSTYLPQVVEIEFLSALPISRTSALLPTMPQVVEIGFLSALPISRMSALRTYLPQVVVGRFIVSRPHDMCPAQIAPCVQITPDDHPQSSQ